MSLKFDCAPIVTLGGTQTLTNKTITAEAEIAVSFINSWGNFGSGFSTVTYYKDPFGVVHIKGTGAGGLVGSAIFQLPLQYRPSEQLSFITLSNGGAGEIISKVVVDTNGNVSAATGGNTYFFLNGITFRV